MNSTQNILDKKSEMAVDLILLEKEYQLASEAHERLYARHEKDYLKSLELIAQLNSDQFKEQYPYKNMIFELVHKSGEYCTQIQSDALEAIEKITVLFFYECIIEKEGNHSNFVESLQKTSTIYNKSVSNVINLRADFETKYDFEKLPSEDELKNSQELLDKCILKYLKMQKIKG